MLKKREHREDEDNNREDDDDPIMKAERKRQTNFETEAREEKVIVVPFGDIFIF